MKMGTMRRAAGFLLLVASGTACHEAERSRALSDIESARGKLARLASRNTSAPAAESIRLARAALLEAERAVREKGPESFEPMTQRALDRTEIAHWVVERQRDGERADADREVEAARAAVESYRQSRSLGLHPSVSARVRLATLALSEAERAFVEEDFLVAAERARDAVELASGLPEDARAVSARLEDPKNRETWRLWVIRALQEARRSERAAFVVDKRSRQGMLWRQNRRPRFYAVELGYNGLRRKLHSGDGATPEGIYRVTRKKQKSDTRYYKALLLDYPNAADRERFQRARNDGRIAKGARIGGLIEIHGEGGRGTNWTDGCVALQNSEMDEVFQELSIGSPVVIVGSYDELGQSGGAN